MPVQVPHHLFTIEEYYRMAQARILGEDDRVELIEGEIIEMTPIGSRHAACVDRLNRHLSRSLADRAIVRIQNPIRLGDRSEPQPDIVLLKPRGDFYANGHPQPADILLVIEVADTSLEYDREVKIPLYARFGSPEVWLIDLGNKHIEKYVKPTFQRYDDVSRYDHSQTITPQSFPNNTINVSDILG